MPSDATFAEFMASAAITSDGAVSKLAPSLEISSDVVFDYSVLTDWAWREIAAGRLLRTVQLGEGDAGAIGYRFFDPAFFCATLKGVTIPNTRFVAREYCMFRLVSSGEIHLETDHESRHVAGVDCSFLSPQHTALGWNARTPDGAPVNSLVVFCHRDFLRSKLADKGPSDFDFEFLETSDDGFTVASLRPTADMIVAAQKLFDLDMGAKFSLLRAEGLCLGVVAEFLGVMGSANASVSFNRRDLERLARAKDILSEEFASAITLEETARRAGLNRRKLTEGFREVYGATVHDFQVRLRMELAVTLMRDDVALADISERVGYATPTSFGRAFRNFYGASPAAYRKALRP